MANEKRLIDADALYDEIEQRYRVSSGIAHQCERDFLNLICTAPTVDAVQVVHGRWIEYGASYSTVGGIPGKCSVCGINGLRYKYCPNCGAKMDGGA